MATEIIVAIIGAISVLGTGLLTSAFTFKIALRQLKQSQNSLKEEVRSVGILERHEKIEEKILSSEKLSADHVTENIKHYHIDELRLFYERFKTKIDVLELFKYSVPYQSYYNLAVYKTYVEQNPKAGQYYISKISFNKDYDLDPKDEVPILRWRARISRLTNNEGEALNDLNILIDNKLVSNNTLELSRLHRSRGFCHFNLGDFEKAILDFETSIQLSESTDYKGAYNYIGLAMSLLSLGKTKGRVDKDKINQYYLKGIEIEFLFKAKNDLELYSNLEKLQTDKKFYFSNLEKSQMKLLIEYINSNN